MVKVVLIRVSITESEVVGALPVVLDDGLHDSTRDFHRRSYRWDEGGGWSYPS